jgi:hypothetical protein
VWFRAPADGIYTAAVEDAGEYCITYTEPELLPVWFWSCELVLYHKLKLIFFLDEETTETVS